MGNEFEFRPGDIMRDVLDRVTPVYGSILLLNAPVAILSVVVASFFESPGTFILGWVVGPIFGGASAILVHRHIRGHQTSVGEAFLAALPKAGALILSNLLVGAIVFIGSIPFGLPGIYLGVRLFATQYEVAIEGKSAFDALNGSWKLTKGHWWGIFGTFLLVGVALLVPLFVMNWMINLIVPQAGDLGILVATLLLFPPVMMIGLSVYGDLK